MDLNAYIGAFVFPWKKIITTIPSGNNFRA